MASHELVRKICQLVAGRRAEGHPSQHLATPLAEPRQEGSRAWPDDRDLAGVELACRIGGELTGSLDVEEVLGRLVEHAADLLGAAGGSVFLTDPQSCRIAPDSITRRMRQPERLLAFGQLRPGHGLAGWVAQQRRGAVVADAEADPRCTRPPDVGQGTRAAVGVPLACGRELLGVLTLAHPQVGRFGDRDLRMLSAVATLGAAAIRNAQLHRSMKSARQRAELERDRLGAVIANLPDGLAILDRQFRPLVVNASATRLLDLPESSRTSLPALLATGRLAVQGPDQEGFLDLLAAGEARPDQILSTEVTTSPDSRRLQLLLAPVRASQRRFIGTVLIVRDVTKEHQLERVKDELVANVSHELQTPLSSIRACAEMLLNEVDAESPDLRRRLLSIVASEAQQLSAFIRNMLDLSRLDHGQLRLSRAVVDLRWVASDVVAALEVQARAAGVTIAVEDEGSPCLAVADRQMLEVILNNLLGNAIKYNEPEGHVWLQLRQGWRHALVSVVDDGPGIPVEALPHVFERFYRVRSTTEGRVKGAGLGLALVKELVEAHGGTIEVESELGRGTRFHVRLPGPVPEHQDDEGGKQSLDYTDRAADSAS